MFVGIVVASRLDVERDAWTCAKAGRPGPAAPRARLWAPPRSGGAGPSGWAPSCSSSPPGGSSTELHVWSTLFVPRPIDVWHRLVDGETTHDGQRGLSGYYLHQHAWASLCGSCAGVGIALPFGLGLGLLLATVRPAQLVLEPYVNFVRALPPLGYFSLLIIWFDIDDAAKVWLLFLAAFPPITLAVLGGVRGIRRERIDGGPGPRRDALAGPAPRRLPSVLPDLFTGLRLAIGFAWTTIVAAETINGIPGLGGLAWQTTKFQQTDVAVLCVVLIGLLAVRARTSSSRRSTASSSPGEARHEPASAVPHSKEPTCSTGPTPWWAQHSPRPPSRSRRRRASPPPRCRRRSRSPTRRSPTATSSSSTRSGSRRRFRTRRSRGRCSTPAATSTRRSRPARSTSGLVGSSPVSRGLSTKIPYEVPWIHDVIGTAEALVVKKGITSIAQLKGKTIATPLASTSHYSLLAALKDAGVPASSVKIIDAAPGRHRRGLQARRHRRRVRVEPEPGDGHRRRRAHDRQQRAAGQEGPGHLRPRHGDDRVSRRSTRRSSRPGSPRRTGRSSSTGRTRRSGQGRRSPSCRSSRARRWPRPRA